MPPERDRSSLSMGRGTSPFAALQRCDLFDGLEHSELVAVALSMRSRSFESGTPLCRAGQPGDRLFVIVEGLAEVLPAAAAAGSRDEAPPVLLLRRGQVTGAAALVAGEPHASTVVAATRTEVLELEREDFDRVTERFPVILRNTVRILSRRLTRSYARAVDERQRGEAVALIFTASLADAIPAVSAAAAAASPRPVAFLDTRDGFHEAVAKLDDLLERSGTVVVAARAEGRSAPLLLDHVDRAVVLAEQEGAAARFGSDASRPRRIEVVLVGAAPAPAGRRATPGVVRVLARDADGTLAPEELAWLGRHLSRTKLGLALGAGGAKGYAHVGALYVLEEAGYKVDYVAGSSIGAIVGAYLGLGMDAAEIESVLRRAFDAETVAKMFQLSLGARTTGLETATRVLRETTGERSFDDLSLPLVVMSVDLTDKRPAPLREGPLWEALLAAIALAGMFPPHERDGHRLVDGLALVPVPTSSVYDEGADVVVAVNLMPRETLPAWPGRPPPPPEQRKGPGSRVLETILEVMDLSQLEESNRHAELADVVLNPRFGPASWRDFHMADLFLAAGREVAQQQLPTLKALAKPQFAGIPT